MTELQIKIANIIDDYLIEDKQMKRLLCTKEQLAIQIASQLEPLVMPKIADLKEALTIALSLWKIAHSPIGVTQDAMVEYKRRIDKLTEIVYPK
jgi:hypothetical protein